MTQPRIVQATIQYPKAQDAWTWSADSGKAVVTATFDDGTSAQVLSYYSDELRFSPEEFVGLTREEVGELFHRKDVAYLQS